MAFRTSSPSHRRYRGHRANPFEPIDINELIEIRARQRTFDGAYRRAALGNFGAALTILRLFDHRFYQIGILYAVLAGLLFIASFFRARHCRLDFADHDKEEEDSSRPRALRTRGQEGQRIFGRPFETAGWIVVAVAVIVAVVEICLMGLVLTI